MPKGVGYGKSGKKKTGKKPAVPGAATGTARERFIKSRKGSKGK